MSFTHVVVDGSNIATEGRSMPSLAQLDEAVREFQREFPTADITVVVDATFGHRIDQSERAMFDDAQAHGELVSPPAGAIGRGDAFLLRIADKAGATVLSNDSFQEFHGEYEWLFTKGRLIGGKPVPGVGWIFTPRTPVRGPKSREAVREARRGRVRVGSPEASQPMPVPKAPPPGPRSSRPTTRHPEPPSSVSEAIATATEEVVDVGPSGPRRRRRRTSVPHDTVNEPLTFITFIAAHPLGAEVEGEVESFSSHGAFVLVSGARCYVPLSAMGDPPPRSARQVMRKGDARTFVVQAFDAQRRGIELALPGFAQLSGAPQEETVEAEIARSETRRRRGRRAAEPNIPEGAAEIMAPEVQQATAAAVPQPADESSPSRRGRRNRQDTAVSQAPAGGETASAGQAPRTRRSRKATAERQEAVPATAEFAGAPAGTAATASTGTKAKKAVAKSPSTRSAAADKRPAAKRTAVEKAASPAKDLTATKAAKAETTKAAASKTAATKAAASKAAASKTAATKAAASKTAATKAAASKTAATKAAASKAAASKAAASKTAAAKSAAAKAAGTKAAETNSATARVQAKKATKVASTSKTAAAAGSAAAKTSGDKAPVKAARPAKKAATAASESTAGSRRPASKAVADKTTKSPAPAKKAAAAKKATAPARPVQAAKATTRRTAKAAPEDEPVSPGRRRGRTSD
ncbi:MAG TPA: S1 RNA-binding domain-containing protein [Acidimicrobiales bacterium]|nr:S1 RNA-binding domain-containing protein [Acidimicrobiales bacterium]